MVEISEHFYRNEMNFSRIRIIRSSGVSKFNRQNVGVMFRNKNISVKKCVNLLGNCSGVLCFAKQKHFCKKNVLSPSKYVFPSFQGSSILIMRILVGWMHLSQSLGQATHPPKGKRKERAMREKVREGSTKGKGGLYKMPQIPTLPPKWPRSGITFH